MSLTHLLAPILRRLIAPDNPPPLAGFTVELRPANDQAHDARRCLNAAFLLALCGPDHPQANAANAWLDPSSTSKTPRHLTVFYRRLRQWMEEEWESVTDPAIHAAFHQAAHWCRTAIHPEWNDEARSWIWRVFFPEGASLLASTNQAIQEVRRQRTVRVTRLNPLPLHDPIRELVLTANVLLGLPHPGTAINRLPLSASLRRQLEQVTQEPQAFWYDHPIPIGIEANANEILYGLRGLDQAIAFEKQLGHAAPQAKMTCLLSVSVTHRGLEAVAAHYLRETLAQAAPFNHLEVYAFTERDARRIIDAVLRPIARDRLGIKDLTPLEDVFGVDGEYGRHYSFLKAITAWWQLFVNPAVRATFKIDLDQVFPQSQLLAQSGGSAFDHFRTPLWGAEGIDAADRPIELGMLAGALVNERDIARSLFTPDVPLPRTIPAGEATVFFNRLPMAVSTAAEMMVRYEAGTLDGRTRCLQRIHVTGGTNGILIDALRRHRPFTPTFIGRAEDQAYLLSVLFAVERPLRYAHQSGLIMRHDKETFASQSMETSKSGRFIGDLVRTLLFSRYLELLPWPVAQIKKEINPFTGCFASAIPVTLVALRFALTVAERYAAGSSQARAEAEEIQDLAIHRMTPMLEALQQHPNRLANQLSREQAGWACYYDTLAKTEELLSPAPAPQIATLRTQAHQIVAQTQII